MSELKASFAESFKDALSLSTFVEAFKEGLSFGLFVKSFEEGWIVFFSPFMGLWKSVRAALLRPKYDHASDGVAAE